MKISKEYKPRAGNTDQLVILVHEPHWLLVGQYQLIPGLKSFLDANSQYKFRFLVEGNFENEIENIPTKPTLDRFPKDVSTTALVFGLLRNALIDGPFAYRLLYDHDLPSMAIDDPEAIKKTPREPDLKDRLEQQKLFVKIHKKLEKLPQEQNNDAMNSLKLLEIYVYADAQELEGQSAIDYSLQMAQLYDALSNQLRSIHAQDFVEECLFLESEAKKYRIQVEILNYALKRDAVMAKNISTHFKSKYADRIPMVFIGNFHTPGITERFSKDISYVVIEPQLSPLIIGPTEKERNNFNDALKPEKRLDYIKRLGGSLKLQVAPLERDLPYYESFLKKEALKIAQRDNAFKASSPLSVDVTSKIINACKQNGCLSGVQINFAGGGQSPPPSLPPGAFASFGSEGKDPNKMIFTIYDRREDNWKNRPDRFNLLAGMLFFHPYEKVQGETKKVTFFPVEQAIYIVFFDPKTQRFYLYEWKEGTDIFPLLLLPKVKGKEELRMHMRTAIRKLMDFEEKMIDG